MVTKVREHFENCRSCNIIYIPLINYQQYYTIFGRDELADLCSWKPTWSKKYRYHAKQKQKN